MCYETAEVVKLSVQGTQVTGFRKTYRDKFMYIL